MLKSIRDMAVTCFLVGVNVGIVSDRRTTYACAAPVCNWPPPNHEEFSYMIGGDPHFPTQKLVYTLRRR